LKVNFLLRFFYDDNKICDSFIGTLLTIVSMLLFACLSAFVVVFVFFAIFGVAAYCGFAHIYDFFGGTEHFRRALINYLQKEGACSNEMQNNNSLSNQSEESGKRTGQTH